MPNNNLITDRLDAAFYEGAKVMIYPFGKMVGEQKAGFNFCPEEPSSYAEPGDWTVLGMIETCKPNTEYKTNDITGVNDQGIYVTRTLKLASKRQLQFATYDIPPEAVQMTFGLKEAIVNNREQALFASGNDCIECWLYLEISDAYRAQAKLASMLMCGKLTLTSPLEAKNDPAQAQFQLDIEPNELSVFTPYAVANAPDADAGS